MSISYDKLWKLLIDKKMNRTALKEAAGISFNVLACSQRWARARLYLWRVC